MGPSTIHAPRPALHTVVDLARWLDLTLSQLRWHVDLPGFEAQAAPRLQHYRYRWIQKASGGQRLLEIPKRRHAGLQRRILDAIVRDTPAHPAAFGFVRGGSVPAFAARHCGQPVVVRLDLTDFFTHVGAARVTGIFDGLGYPRAVARCLRGLCTNVAPTGGMRSPMATAADRRRAWWRRKQLGQPHLPQGACTSPMLANLAAFGLDRRLTALAQAYDARYARYADDLAFSGGAVLQARMGPFIHRVGTIVQAEGFALNRRKIRVMRAGGRQRLAGVVVNTRPNLSRADFDRLKAIVHNCVRHGPASQRGDHPDFRAHLRGRIGWLMQLNPTRGAKLLAAFERIDWSAG